MRHVITLLFLALAIAAYFVGSMTGVAIFIGVGVVFEGVVWLRLLKRNGNP